MSLKTTFSALLILGALVIAGCGPAAPPPTPTPIGDANAGKTKFSATCIACHGADAKGVTGLGKDLTISTFIAEKTDLELVDFLMKGRPSSDPLNTTGVDMPPKGGNPALTNSDLGDIVAFLRSIHTK